MWTGIDRRKFPRANFPCKVIIHKKQGVDKYFTQTQNISVGGICAIMEKDLGLFSQAEVEVALDEKNTIKSAAKIVWIIKKTSEGPASHHFDTGFEFVDLKPADQKKLEKSVKRLFEKHP